MKGREVAMEMREGRKCTIGLQYSVHLSRAVEVLIVGTAVGIIGMVVVEDDELVD